jgi:hypothetical protein
LQAVAKGLPRHWVPQVDGVTGQCFFLNTRTGALHRHHPHVREVLLYAARARPAAEAQLVEQLQQLRQYGARVQAAFLRKQQLTTTLLRAARAEACT